MVELVVMIAAENLRHHFEVLDRSHPRGRFFGGVLLADTRSHPQRLQHHFERAAADAGQNALHVQPTRLEQSVPRVAHVPPRKNDGEICKFPRRRFHVI
jgi:hypothetical protein